MNRIPALRFGERYTSLTQHPIIDLGSGEQLGSLSQVIEAMIATDCQRGGRMKRALDILQRIPVRERIKMSCDAAAFFRNATLDGGGVPQTPLEYIETLARVSGLSHRLALDNTGRICDALHQTEAIMNGLSRGLPLDIYDTGFGVQGGANVRINPRIPALGCLMPNNSPGVNVIWLIALAFGIPVLIRPGSSEPLTPYRLIQAHIAAGYPEEVFGFYPCDHAAANRIPTLTGGAIVFGSDKTVQQWANNPLVHIHGAGYSKVFIGDDLIDDWESLIPELVINVAANSGRSCFAASRICVPRHGQKIADALAVKLSQMVPLPLHHREAVLSAMAMPTVAKAVDGSISELLLTPGARDASAPYRCTRLVTFEGRTYLLPTVIQCDSNSHPLANQEFLFPYVAVVECSTDDAFAQMGFTLSLAVYTKDDALKERTLKSQARLVSINVPTVSLDRKQPHEEELFPLCWERTSCIEA